MARKKFSERSKPVKFLMVFGGLFWFVVILTSVRQSEKPDTPEEIREREVRAMIADIRTECDYVVERHLKIKRGAEIPLFNGRITPVDPYGLRYKYVNTVSAKNAFGATLEQRFDCQVAFKEKKPVVVYLKIGKSVLIKE